MGLLDEQLKNALESTFGKRLEDASEETEKLREEMVDVRRELERRNEALSGVEEALEEQTELLRDIQRDL